MNLQGATDVIERPDPLATRGAPDDNALWITDIFPL